VDEEEARGEGEVETLSELAFRSKLSEVGSMVKVVGEEDRGPSDSVGDTSVLGCLSKPIIPDGVMERISVGIGEEDRGEEEEEEEEEEISELVFRSTGKTKRLTSWARAMHPCNTFAHSKLSSSLPHSNVILSFFCSFSFPSLERKRMLRQAPSAGEALTSTPRRGISWRVRKRRRACACGSEGREGKERKGGR